MFDLFFLNFCNSVSQHLDASHIVVPVLCEILHFICYVINCYFLLFDFSVVLKYEFRE